MGKLHPKPVNFFSKKIAHQACNANDESSYQEVTAVKNPEQQYSCKSKYKNCFKYLISFHLEQGINKWSDGRAATENNEYTHKQQDND